MLNFLKTCTLYLSVFFPLFAQAERPRPNFVIIVTDDQRYDQMQREFLPQTHRLLVDQGTSFSKAYVTNPACCPSRSSILTGKYNSSNKVYGNRYPLPEDQKTIAHFLKEIGYRTGLVGKFLNSWDGTPRPEYDFWFSHRGAVANYVNPTMNDNGVVKQLTGYVTTLLSDQAVRFIQESARKDEAFFLFFTPNAPHEPAIPEEKYASLYSDLKAPRNEAFNIEAVRKPAHAIKKRALDDEKITAIDSFYRDQLRALRSVDDGVARIVGALEKTGTLANTAIFFISDNGVFLGEYRLKGKSKVYEPSIHVPLVMRYDPLCKKKTTTDALVANIDIAPTILHLAGIPIPYHINGKSLRTLCEGSTQPLHRYILIESWGNRRKRGNKGFMALHTGDSVYVENEDDISEFYLLSKDPLQLNNRINIGNYLAQIEDNKTHLHKLVGFLRGSVSYEITAEEVPGFGGPE